MRTCTSVNALKPSAQSQIFCVSRKKVQARFTRNTGFLAWNWKQPPSSNGQQGEDKAGEPQLGVGSDVGKIYLKAQQNIQEINSSRVTALNELNSCKRRIKELESQLQEANERAQAVLSSTCQQQEGQKHLEETVFSFEQEEDKVQDVKQGDQQEEKVVEEEEKQLQQSVTSTAVEKVPDQQLEVKQEVVEKTAVQVVQEETQEQKVEEVQEKEQPQTQEVQKDTIRLIYLSGWQDVHLHFNADDKGWTDPPGQHMATEHQDGKPRSHELTIDCSKIEFVLNNGENDWDSPGFGSSKKNYTINSPGTYKLKDGVVEKLS